MRIKRLSDSTINKIAAGEVIERPMSVVKELVENSIDAQAHNIIVSIQRGGRNAIVVSDDGIGICKDDLAVAIERHATSKLLEEDISQIAYNGFRGEALPSIGAVGQLKIVSKSRDEDEAWEIEVYDGENSRMKPASHRQGTTVEVCNLFCFTPNRLKFLKGEVQEVSACTSLIERFAIVHPHIAFKLVSDGKTVLDYKCIQGEANDERIKDVLGDDFIKNSIPVDAVHKNMAVRGYVSLPTYSRGVSTNFYTYVNSRIVKDKVLSTAIRVAYQGLLPRDRFPVVVLFIDIEPQMVDVNVHPTKAEVRFRDESSARGLIISSIRKAIAANNTVHSTTVADASKVSLSRNLELSGQSEAIKRKELEGETHGTYNRFVGIPRDEERNRTWNSNAVSPSSDNKDYRVNKGVVLSDRKEMHKSSDRVEPVPIEDNVVVERNAHAVQKQKAFDVHYPLGYAKCQIGNLYIIAESEDGMVILDQHAAHERLVLEGIKEQIIEGKYIKSQHLLIPEVLELGARGTNDILGLANVLSRFGILIERNGISQIVITAVPLTFGELDIKGFLTDFSSQVMSDYEGGSVDPETFIHEKLNEICSKIACYSSVRAGRKLSVEEMNAMLREVEKTGFGAQCNHGRPTFTKLSLDDLKKVFERV
ncbi:DNA mismatch repair endonuclease MutL [Rickettsiales endosymbiont of Peranema trichophorum]|uniref:DNA mismatch repair endonuclease MutL n=1 Tax=Rickettsiales endosymbiont of Peranema trichophorum TaxID=2486577 RepID=UPI001022AEAC|nr:DNA mismatch repair endonuclease MutL [Rickettsiales endosymbiont of Peranema trichophorum]RZI47279.1 DNA mismatch repair endonuclease MutL [Rickettsiales endosymbiont of Peranema trichophorum]